jgi:UDP-N-acetylmuramoyl-L-alanyl-D-glutamate--2,6-diaminopimelate ligase
VKTAYTEFENIFGLKSHSKSVESGDLFYVMGSTEVVSKYIPDVKKNDAVGLVVPEDFPEEFCCGMKFIRAADVREQFRFDCEQFYSDLFSSFELIGITGTKGKSTIAWLLRDAIELSGKPCAYMGTLGVYDGKDLISSVNTTHGLQDFIAWLRKFKKAKIDTVVCEVSSQGLEQQRVPVGFFKTRIFTDLSEEHLDAHLNMQNYFGAKCMFFEGNEFSFFGLDRSNWVKKIPLDESVKTYTYGLENNSLFQLKDYQLKIEGTEFSLEFDNFGHSVNTGMPGFFNAENILCVISVLRHLGMSVDKLCESISKLSPPAGRMEKIVTHNQATVFVDYAHSSQSLEFVLKSTKPMVKSKLYVLFGCGGDRDPRKRPKMANSAQRYADFVIVTNDNPRTENENKIIEQICEGFSSDFLNYKLIPDRRAAIQKGMDMLKEGDVLLVCGKGHEDYQILGDKRIHFSDKEEILEYASSQC